MTGTGGGAIGGPAGLRAVSVEPGGGLLGGNVYAESAAAILERYEPGANAREAGV